MMSSWFAVASLTCWQALPNSSSPKNWSLVYSQPSLRLRSRSIHAPLICTPTFCSFGGRFSNSNTQLTTWPVTAFRELLSSTWLLAWKNLGALGSSLSAVPPASAMALSVGNLPLSSTGSSTPITYVGNPAALAAVMAEMACSSASSSPSGHDGSPSVASRMT